MVSSRRQESNRTGRKRCVPSGRRFGTGTVASTHVPLTKAQDTVKLSTHEAEAYTRLLVKATARSHGKGHESAEE